MKKICEYIENNFDKNLSLKKLAMLANLSPAHFQRSFKEAVGISPKEYQQNFRLQKFKQELRKKGSVTNAIYDAGFGSTRSVYEKTGARLGMTPKQYRAAGRDVEISYMFMPSILGKITIAATDRGICFLSLGESLAELQAEFPAANITPMGGKYKKEAALWAKALDAFLAGQKTPEVKLDAQGTAFQMKVWKYLQTIPRGKTQTYAEVATGIGQPSAARAVARACATNNISLLIPCHRVIRGSGELAGYRWGIERKKKLLELERE